MRIWSSRGHASRKILVFILASGALLGKYFSMYTGHLKVLAGMLSAHLHSGSIRHKSSYSIKQEKQKNHCVINFTFVYFCGCFM